MIECECPSQTLLTIRNYVRQGLLMEMMYAGLLADIQLRYVTFILQGLLPLCLHLQDDEGSRNQVLLSSMLHVSLTHSNGGVSQKPRCNQNLNLPPDTTTSHRPAGVTSSPSKAPSVTDWGKKQEEEQAEPQTQALRFSWTAADPGTITLGNAISALTAADPSKALSSSSNVTASLTGFGAFALDQTCLARCGSTTASNGLGALSPELRVTCLAISLLLSMHV